jgi:hypothetical protein
MKRNLLVPAFVAIVVASLFIGQAGGSNGTTNNKTFQYTVGLWGDMPYSDLQATEGVPNLIADMNKSDIVFSVHNGDLKAGSGTPGSTTPTICSDDLYTQTVGYLNALEKPAMITPGDNDWTDCDRAANGGFNSRERLDHEREVFFSTPFSLGQHTMKLEVQSTPSCLGFSGPVACVENRRWTYKSVTFATLNIPGSCNNLCDMTPDPAEFAARDAANIQWLHDTFAAAKANGSLAVMLIAQANPGFDLADGTRAPTRNPRTLGLQPPGIDGYEDFLIALREETIDFGMPVAYVHGDSHYFRVDKPFLDSQGQRLENFTRVETFGNNAANENNDVHWVKALIDPSSRDVFAFQAQVVPLNRTAVP